MPGSSQQQKVTSAASLAGQTQSNGGPRVSFNRDVHVKRIGKHQDDLVNIEIPKIPIPPPYHQLPSQLSTEGIRREAALVLDQADRHKSKTDNGDNIPNLKLKTKRSSVSAVESSNPKKFNSLPSRKKKPPSKPVKRSSSDAAAKKPLKRPSIFNFFTRKSDSNVAQADRDPRFEDSGGRRLVRSKSDVGSASTAHLKEDRKLKKSLKDSNSSNKHLPSQLSPIIENIQKENYFEQQFNRERRKSDAITDREKHESGIDELLERSREKAELDGSLLTRNRISEGIKDKILTLQAKSNENMHSSQMPAQRLPLTRGVTVNGLAKRLSMERFSPPPRTGAATAFSYIRPNEGLNYAQLDHEQNVHHLNSLNRKPAERSYSRDYKSPLRDVRSLDRKNYLQRSSDYPSQSPPNGYYNEDNYKKRESISPQATSGGITTIRISPWQQLSSPRNFSDEDEGLGIETRKYFEDEYRKDFRSKSPSEPPIVPVIRNITPSSSEREHASYDKQQRQYSPPDMHDNEMEYRRSRLESNILTRRYGENRNNVDRVVRSPDHSKNHHNHNYLRFQNEDSSHLSNMPSSQENKSEPISRYNYERGYPHTRQSDRLDVHCDISLEEPKSYNSKLSTSDHHRYSPEKRHDFGRGKHTTKEHWQSSLKRDKQQQRSFDKGDSGIENDFRKESFNGDVTTKWRSKPQTTFDKIKACETFLKKEQRHTEKNQQLARAHQHRNDHYIYRERSIDDGSHFDPHLDKYPVAKSTFRRSISTNRETQTGPDQDTLKRKTKLGGFEKVKQLFSGTNGESNENFHGYNNGASRKETLRRANSNTLTSTSMGSQVMSKDKDKYMVKEEEMRSRYREHNGSSLLNDSANKASDISTRRRLSTPKASPLLLKRTSSEKNRKESPLAKPEKLGWFKSLDRRHKNKSKERLNVTANKPNETSTLKRSKASRTTSAPPSAANKSLRFFGDTDLDSNPPTFSKGSTNLKSRPYYSHSAFQLDYPQRSRTVERKSTPLASTSHVSRHKSTSMHNLGNGGTDEVDFRKRRHYSRSRERELDDISESGSETEENHKRLNSMGTRSVSRELLDRSRRQNENSYKHSNGNAPTASERNTASNSTLKRNYLIGPPKPARSAERKPFSQRDNERYPAESSGTEGESSLQSQRSIVYLHATTVGDIPQPYHLRRRSISREDLHSTRGSQKQQPLQPMTRTVSRSVSMLAPWKPKHISEGYEINYSQEQTKKMSTMPRKSQNDGSSTLTRNGKKTSTPTNRSRRYDFKDDQSSFRNSSTTSASKSGLSSNLRSKK